jgi:PAS domain S-box-containing protein/putative nucleotidyltransferase with HDIG domain
MNAPGDTVLIVDDEQVVRKLLRASLCGNGRTCLEANGAEEAMDQLKNHTVDLALIDIKMQGKSGIELLVELRASYPETAVIMISAVSSTETAVECMRQGAYDYLSKPFGPNEAVLRIEHALERRRLTLDNRDYQLHLERRVEEETEQIRASEENFRSSVDNSPLGIRIVSADGRTIYANPALLDMYRYGSIGELDASPTQLRFTPASYSAHQERAKRRKLGDSVSPQYETDIVRKNGEIRHLLVNRSEVLWDGTKQSQVLYQDITERVQTERALAESRDQLNKTLESVIQSMALIVEMRDPYTAGHQRRVARLACAIAGEMGLPQEMIDGIRVAGTIHDIGKIGVPTDILSKPGRISKAEFILIKEHPRTGYEILKGIDFPWPIARAVLQHHERMNGTGYPDQLEPESIILEARILAVADVIEAMGSHRPYRAALGIEKALEEISLNRGVLYDPVVADACLKLFDENIFGFDWQTGAAVPASVSVG